MRDALAKKEQELADLAAEKEKVEDQLDIAKDDLTNAAADYENLRSVSETSIIRLEDTVTALSADLAAHAVTIANLQREALSTAETHANAIEDRDEEIANLNHQMYETRQQIEVLEKEKASLERRVESEAEAMLELQADKDDHISDLQATVRSKQAEIEHLSKKASEVDHAWNALMRQRDAEIVTLTETATETDSTIVKLRTENRSMRDLFRQFVRDATATTEGMRTELEAVRNSAADKDRELKEEGQRLMDEMDKMDSFGEVEPVQHSAVKKVKKTTKKTVRQYDSGVGVGELA